MDDQLPIILLYSSLAGKNSLPNNIHSACATQKIEIHITYLFCSFTRWPSILCEIANFDHFYQFLKDEINYCLGKRCQMLFLSQTTSRSGSELKDIVLGSHSGFFLPNQVNLGFTFTVAAFWTIF